MAQTPRILLNAAELHSLIGGAVIPYKVNNQRIEIALVPISAKAVIMAVLDRVDGELSLRPADPPQAREFLPVRRRKTAQEPR
jgi:hypothetical protein